MGENDRFYGWRWVFWFAIGCCIGIGIMRIVLG